MKFPGFVKSLATKIVALLLATIVWVIVSSERRERVSERAFDVPLALVGVPRDLIVTTPIQETISVRMKARLSALRALSSQSLEATLDLSEARSGDFTYPVRPQSINVPNDVEVVSMSPARISLRLEPRRQKYVPIRPYLVGELPGGYVLGDVTVVPENALVSGPASTTRDLAEVATDRIILTGRNSTFRAVVALVSDYPLVRVIDPVSAQVEVEVLPKPEQTDTSGPPPSSEPQKTTKGQTTSTQ